MRERRFLLLAMALGGVAAFAIAPSSAAQKTETPATGNLPTVYGGGILMAFSGLDGKTSVAEPCVASTIAGGIGLRFHLPKEPVLRIRPADPRPVTWCVVSGDLLLAKMAGDDVPMVVAFVSANAVAGRLPPGALVTLEGGDAGVVLMRSDVANRTKFAMAYDPKGAKAAAQAASAALNTSIDTLVESRLEFFSKAPRAAEGATALQAAALAKAMSVMKVNTCSPEDPIPVRWTTPSRWPHQHMWPYDSALNSLGVMHLDVRLAKESLEAVLGFQAEDGFIPLRTGGETSDASHPPVIAWAAWNVYQFDKMQDPRFLGKAFDAAQKHVIWYMKNRRLDGPPPAEKPLEHGAPLYAWKSAEESGMDNSPRFDDGPAFAAIDLSCYLANECWTLQVMAQRLGYRELAKTWGARGNAIAEAARRQLWDAERGFFFDRKTADGQWCPAWTVAGLLPLWAGVATPEQAERLKGHLLSKKFWTDTPVATVARDDPKFKSDMWCGPAWISVNYLLVRGLHRYGLEKEAAQLRSATLDTVARWYGRTGCFWEFYDADGRTPPPDLDREGQLASGQGLAVVADYNRTAALYADLMLRPRP